MDPVNKTERMYEKYRTIFNNAPIGICITETDGTINFNNTFCKMLGYNHEELLEYGWKQITVKEDIEKYHEIIDIFNVKDTSPQITQKRFIRKNGSIMFAEVTSQLRTNEDGTPDFLLSMIRDITEHKKIVQQLEEHEFKYQQLFDSNPNAMWIYDCDTLKFLLVNNAAVEQYGYTHQEFLGMTVKDIKTDDNLTKMLEYLRKNTSTINESDTYKHKRKNGETFLVKISTHSISFNGYKARVAMVLDVTEKVQAKQSLVNEVAKLKSIVESTTDIIFSIDTNYNYTTFNSVHFNTMKKLHNVEIEIGKSILSYIAVSEDREKAKVNIDKAFNGDRVSEISISGEKTLDQRYFEITHNPIKDENNVVIGVSVFAKDITEAKNAIDLLEKREKEFFTLFSEDLTGDFVSTADGKIILCNPRFLEIFGFNSEEEAYNTSALDLYKNPSDHKNILDKINSDKKIENFEIEMIRRDGKAINVLENIIGQYDENNNLVKLIGYVLDVTAQKKAFEKVKQLSQAVEQSPETIVITDTEGTIQYINQKGLQITGYTEKEILGQNPRVLSSGEKSKEDYKILWETIKSGKEWRGEFHNKKKSGELYWEQASISPIFNDEGKIVNFLAVKEDITEKKKVELELNAAREKAEEINKIKSVFFSNMSHELRTPLVGILGFADILSNNLSDENDKSMANSILHSGKRLLNTLSSILSLSELENIKENIELETLDVNAICKDALKHYEATCANKVIEFKNDFQQPKLFIKINDRLLRESLNQLLSNAITYTEKGWVEVKTYVKSKPASSSQIGVIEVIDTGIGIPVDKQKVVFEEFRQASEGFGRNFEGTGLGLTLTKKYVELMGGQIKLISEVNKGTKVILEFSIEDYIDEKQITMPESATTKNIKPTNIAAGKVVLNKKILIVENDEINQVFLEKCIGKQYQYKSVSNGLDAVKLSAEEDFDLILMDINLGKDMDGLTAMKAIRKISGYKNKPIIAMTAYVDEQDKDLFLASGFSNHLPKPFLQKDIINLLNNLLADF